MNSVGGKRPFEGSVEMGAPAPKRAAPNKDQELFQFCRWGETDIPMDVITRIVSFLSKREIFQFPALAKGAGAFTEVRFKEIKKRNRLDFSLPGDEKENYPERASVISLRVLMKYLDQRDALIQRNALIRNRNPNEQFMISPCPQEEQTKALYQQFRSIIITHLPYSLGSFIWKDLNSMAPLKFLSKDDKLFLEEPSSQASENANPASLAGGELLKGLSHLTTCCDSIWRGNQNQTLLSQEKALPHLESAMRSGATIAPSFVIQILSPLSSPLTYSLTYKYCENLAITSSSHNDYRGLELLLTRNMMNAVGAYQSGLHYPPILGVIAIKNMLKEHPPQEIEPLFKEAIKGYGDPLSIPIPVWVYAGGNQFLLSKHKQAEEYLERALKEEDSLPDFDRSQLWYYLTMVKTELHKWEEADRCSTQLFIASCLSQMIINSSTYVAIALTNAYLGKWGKANCYLNKALSIPYPQPDHHTWAKATRIKILDRRWEQAERFSQNYMDCVNPPTVDMLAGMALIKFHLKNLPEAKTYIDKALAAYQANPPLVLPPHVKQLANDIDAQYALLNVQ